MKIVSLALIIIGISGFVLFCCAQTERRPFVGAAKLLDYEVFKTKVEPIFLKKRGDHARCYVCHENSRVAFNLVPLSAGQDGWTEEQSRRNFQMVSALIVPGEPTKSRLLMHPLDPRAGGDPSPLGVHDGGHQFSSQDDPDWMVLADWVRKKVSTDSAQ
jgi:hypothetical protein